MKVLEQAQTFLDKEYERIVKEHENTLDAIKEAINTYRYFLPEDFELPAPASVHAFFKDLVFEYPRSTVLVNEVRNIINQKIDPEKATVDYEDSSSRDGKISIRIYKKPWNSTWFHIIFSPNLPNSKCVLKKISTRMVSREEPVYEVICEEGAKENALGE